MRPRQPASKRKRDDDTSAEESFRAAMSNRAVPRGAAVHAAARKGDDAVVRALLDAGADKDLANNDGATPLFIAAHDGHDAIVRTLLGAGADKDRASNDGYTPLMAAAAFGHVEVARVLLAAGANKTKKDASGKTALKRAKTAEMKRLLR